MNNSLQLERWYYLKTDLAHKEKILNKIENKLSIESLQLDLKPFKVPGTLQSNMRDYLGINPYFEENMQEFSSAENDALLLISEFSLSKTDSSYYIYFDHIDTIAEIYLNGILIDNTENAFIQHEVSIPNSLLAVGKNLVCIFLSPAMVFVNNDVDLPEIRDRVFVRRPTFNFGWDFAPRAVLIGIGEVKIYQKSTVSLNDVFVVTESCDEKKANLSIEWAVVIDNANIYSFILKIISLKGDKIVYQDEFTQNLEIGRVTLKKRISIDQPNLWWPNKLGNQSLYCLEITEKSTGNLITTKFGIRKIELILKEKGKDKFIFEINGKRIWAKGANWVPTDALTNFSDEEKYNELLLLAENANFNMIRIWGGGVVEKDIFYDLCDERGIMIWHDFQFACSVYPEDDIFLSNVKNEVTSIVKRLRNHPSIVLWCGNNENEWIYYQHYTVGYREEIKLGEKLHHLKKRLCRKYDPTRPYWRSSPWSPSAEYSFQFNPNSQEEGNCHDWFVWHGLKQPHLQPPEYEYYATNRARFISEFGIQSFPVKETIEKIFSIENQQSPNEVWNFHNCNLEKINVNMRKFGKPHDIDDWILFTQAAQAFGMKFAIEIWRSRKFETAGALIWQFNEPWPTICWSIVDYYNCPKMAYWAVKRAFKPLIVFQDPLSEKVIIVNDYEREIKGSLLIRDYTFKGKLLAENQYNVSIKPNSTEKLVVYSQVLSKNDLRWIKFQYGEEFAENLVLPFDPVELDFPDPQIEANLDREKQIITFLSKEFAFLVNIPLDYKPSDNYFHLIPNVPLKIRLDRLPKGSRIRLSIWRYKEKYINL